MLASLLTQLLGKVAEAKLMHAKACNLPNVMLIPCSGCLFVCGLGLCICRCRLCGCPEASRSKAKV